MQKADDQTPSVLACMRACVCVCIFVDVFAVIECRWILSRKINSNVCAFFFLLAGYLVALARERVDVANEISRATCGEGHKERMQRFFSSLQSTNPNQYPV